MSEVWIVRMEPTSALYGLPTAVEYPAEHMAIQAAESLRRHSTFARVWIEHRSPVAAAPDVREEQE